MKETHSEQQICYLCKSDVPTLSFYSPSGGDFRTCRACGLIAMKTLPSVAELSRHYNKHYYAENYKGRGREHFKDFAYRLRFFNRYFKSPGRFLEVGAAGGDFLQLMKERGWQVHGVELSEHAVRAGEKNYALPMFCGTLEEVRFPDAAFDAVAFYHVIEHLPDPRSVLREARRILAPDGYLLVEVPNPKGLDARFSRKLLESIIDYPNHLHLFPKRTLERLLTDSGFKVIRIEASVSFMLVHFVNQFFLRHRGQEEAVRSHKPLLFKVYPHTGLFSRMKEVVADFLRPIVPGMTLTVVAQKESS